MRLTLIALALASLSLQAAPAKKKPRHAASTTEVHVVRQGETAAAIARKAGLSLAQLESLNPSQDLGKLALGTKLRIKATKAATTKPVLTGETVVLAKGQTLHGLAKEHGFTVADLVEANPGLKPTRIKAGARIHLPSAAPALEAAPSAPGITLPPMAALPTTPASRNQSLAHLERLLPFHPRLPEPSGAFPPAQPVPQSSARALELNRIVAPVLEPEEALHAFIPADPDHLDLLWPVETRTVSSNWGPRMRSRTVRVKNNRKKRVRYKGRHRGVDLNAPQGTDVYSAMAGEVVVAGRHRQYGNYVMIDHGNGVVTLYAHHRMNLVSVGDVVNRGQKIAEVGRTGNATGPHLHFELQVHGLRTNPLPFLNDEEEIPEELQAVNARLGAR
ncbi:MAG: LysM peptidoglycan-binding domain-containing M23 family metallopeptidase [Acidobacteria bacterium]|nr:LysM peptidoglycan-binding domain-containing M23 family metallopeptidase [Acidobacteriota bacterium]